MTFVGIAAGTAVAGLGVDVYKTISEAHQASVINKGNVRPTYQIPQEFYENLNIANQLAQQGIPQQTYNNEVNQIGQNQAAALATAQNSNNPAGAVQGILGQSNRAITNLNAGDADQRLQNLRYAMQVRGQLAQQKLAQQQYNQFDKYTEQFNKAAALQGASNQNLEQAVSGASGLATGLAKTYGSSTLNSRSQDPLSALSPQSNWGNPITTGDAGFPQTLGG